MLNRRYLGWLIAGAYVAPYGPFAQPVAAASAAGGEPAGNPSWAYAPVPRINAATDADGTAIDPSRGSHRHVTARC